MEDVSFLSRGRDASRGRHVRSAHVALCTAVAGLAVVALTACSGGGDSSSGNSSAKGGTVTVMGSWSGAEQDSFLAMVAPWEQRTGTKVQYTGSRDLQTQLTTGIASGNLPDVAGLPGVGLAREWYDQGALKSLDFVDAGAYRSASPPGLPELAQSGDGKLIGVFTKASVKGLVYYNKANWKGAAPANWDQLTQQARAAATGTVKPWCVGLESGAASGWPATDWIEDILLRQSGPQVYDAWVAGKQRWTSPEIRKAWETFGEVLKDSHGGSKYVVNTNFGRAANPMFAKPAGCLLHHQASFITDFFANEAGAKPGDYDFFPFPDIAEEHKGSTIIAADLMGMFNDTPQARSLIQYLLTPEAQQIWVKRGGFIATNRNVSLDNYPDDASRKSAQILANARTTRFDGSDQFPGAMNDAFFKATVRFTTNPEQLGAILTELDKVQADAYQD